MNFNDGKLWVRGNVMSTIGFELEKVQIQIPTGED
jgi:hypothetical protein